MRRTILAIGSALALTVAGLSSPVMAQRHMHFGGAHFGHFGGGFRHFGGGRFAFGFAGPVWGGPVWGGCSTVRRAWTPFGWRWHRVWVC